MEMLDRASPEKRVAVCVRSRMEEQAQECALVFQREKTVFPLLLAQLDADSSII